MLKWDYLLLVVTEKKWYLKFKEPDCQMQAPVFAEEAL